MLVNIDVTVRYRTKPTLHHQDLKRSQIGSKNPFKIFCLVGFFMRREPPHKTAASGGGRVLFEDDGVGATLTSINPPLQLVGKCVIDESICRGRFAKSAFLGFAQVKHLFKTMQSNVDFTVRS
jgi:hypothetical protein